MRRNSDANPGHTLSVIPMASVPSPTSLYGYRIHRVTNVWKYRPRGYTTWPSKFTDLATYAVTNRPAPVTGSPPLATSYYRKLCYLTSMNSVEVSTTSHDLQGDSSIHSRGVQPNMSPHGSNYGSSSVTAPQWMTDQCVQGCMEALLDLRANILEDAGQAKQTVEMMASIVKTIVDLFLIAWKRDWKALRRRLKRYGNVRSGANGWLMYYYGIRPLVSTLQALADSYPAKRKLKNVVRKISDPVDPLGFVDSPLVRDIRASGTAEIGVKVGMTIAVDMTATISAFTSLGLASPMSDSVVTAWALVPYSFVVDWILPVERYLRTRSWQSGLAYQSGYIDKRLLCDAMFTTHDPMTGANDRGSLPKVKLEAIQLQRIAYNSFSPPSGLSFKLSLNPTQTVNAIALAIQRM